MSTNERGIRDLDPAAISTNQVSAHSFKETNVQTKLRIARWAAWGNATLFVLMLLVMNAGAWLMFPLFAVVFAADYVDSHKDEVTKNE